MNIVQNENIIEVVFDVSLHTEEEQFEQAQELQRNLQEIYGNNPNQQFGVLLDLTITGLHISTSSSRTRKAYEEILKMNQTTKIAVLGEDSFVGKVVGIIQKYLPEKKANWFVNRKEALLWLDTE